jgi:hypothetical protein
MIATRTIDQLEDPALDTTGLAATIERASEQALDRLNAAPEDVERGLARLVLAVIELLRQLLERQAIRRVEAGSLTDAEIERLGTTFLKLEHQMGVLKRTFGLEDDDLNIDLGPLSTLR